MIPVKALNTRMVESSRRAAALAGELTDRLKGRRRGAKHGFTFIELMIAIVVLIVIAALVLPSLETVSDESKFKSACDQLSSVASVCRAEAKRTGKPVAVIATRGEDGRQSIVSVPLGDAENLKEEGGTVEVDSRVLMVMPHGVSVYAEAVDQTDAAKSSADDHSISVEAEGAESTQSLIIYWANGEATTSTPFGVKSSTGRTAAAKVNSWTGAVSIGQSPEPTTSSASTASTDDADEPTATEIAEDQLDEHAQQDPFPVNAGSTRVPVISSPEG